MNREHFGMLLLNVAIAPWSCISWCSRWSGVRIISPTIWTLSTWGCCGDPNGDPDAHHDGSALPGQKVKCGTLCRNTM